MLLPSVTGLGESELVTLMSAWPAVATTTVAVALLLFGFGSGVVAETSTVSVMTVPEAVPAVTFTTTVNVADALAANAAIEHVRDPTGAGQLQPAAGATETKVVLRGMPSVKDTLVAAAVPLFFTTTV